MRRGYRCASCAAAYLAHMTPSLAGSTPDAGPPDPLLIDAVLGDFAPADSVRDQAAPPTLRVLHVITSLGVGGAERQLEYLVRDTRHDVSVVALYSGGAVADQIVEGGLTVAILGMEGWHKVTAVVRLARHIRRRSPDVVHVHLLSAQLFGITAARLARVPVVVSTEHSLTDGSIEGRPKSRWLRLVYRVLERGTTRTVAVSRRTAERLAEWGVAPRRVAVIENAVDFAASAFDGAARVSVRGEWGCPDQARVIGAVGRLVPDKRFETLLCAVAPILRSEDAHLVIVGEGQQARTLAALASSLGVRERVHLPGIRPDIGRALSGFDVFVSASHSETFGMAIVESVANGLPTVFEQCPPLEGIEPSLPWIVHIEPGQERDQSALRQAVYTQLYPEATRWPVPGELARRYGIAGTTAAYDRLYEDLVAPAGHHASRRPTLETSVERVGRT